MPGNRKAKHDIAPRARRALWDGLVEHARRQGKTLTEVAADWWQDDWKAALKALATFMPREKHVSGEVSHTHEHTHTAQTDEFLRLVLEKEKEQKQETRH